MSLELLDNLEKYRRQNGKYPVYLSQISRQTETGMVAYSHLRYQRAEAQSQFSGYEIRGRTGFGLGFDSFFYWPDEKYPPRIYGGSTEIIRTPRHAWAYVHE